LRYPDRRTPDGKPYDPDDIPAGLPGDGPLHGEFAIWLYIAKGLGLLTLGALLLTQLMYGLFELLSWLG
jgi:hypothetical protein